MTYEEWVQPENWTKDINEDFELFWFHKDGSYIGINHINGEPSYNVHVYGDEWNTFNLDYAKEILWREFASTEIYEVQP